MICCVVLGLFRVYNTSVISCISIQSMALHASFGLHTSRKVAQAERCREMPMLGADRSRSRSRICGSRSSSLVLPSSPRVSIALSLKTQALPDTGTYLPSFSILALHLLPGVYAMRHVAQPAELASTDAIQRGSLATRWLPRTSTAF